MKYHVPKRWRYENSGLVISPPIRLLTSTEANSQLKRWHYLGTVKGIIFAVGHDEGCCVFTNCRSREYEKRIGCRVVELARMVGKPKHKWAMSSLMAAAVKEAFKRGYQLIVTYADPYVGHHGKVYLAANWQPDGTSSKDTVYLLDGKRISRRYLYDLHGTQSKSRMKEIYGNRLQFEPSPPKQRFIKRRV